MALRPWRGRQSGREKWKARLCGGGRAVPMCRPKSRRPVPPGLNPIVLDLEVQGLVVGLEVSRRLALVPLAGLEGVADGLLLRLGGGRGGDRPEEPPACPESGPQAGGAGEASVERARRCSGRIPSGLRSAARRTTFLSSRTFPGQG